MRKKTRVVQFGVGPIGASIVRLMRQKHSLEIVGAIDSLSLIHISEPTRP